MLYVTHDPHDALGFADETLILDTGKIIEKGSSKSIYYQPRKFNTAILTGYCNWLSVENFHSSANLHRIKNKFLVRPDQVKLFPDEQDQVYLAIIDKIEFHGFYQLIYLNLKNLGIITGIQLTNQDSFVIGQEVPICFKPHRST